MDDPAPTFAFPFQRLPRGTVAVRAQNSDAAIDDSLAVLANTNPGERYDEPEYGMPDYAFKENGADPSVITSVIRKWEPRASGRTTEKSFVDLVQTLRVETATRQGRG
jgi:phage baseplate assembly protein W